MAKIRVINPANGKTKETDVADEGVSAYVDDMARRKFVVVDMASGDILSNMPEKFGAVGGAWEGLKTGLSAGIPLVGDEEARAREAEVERQQPEAYAGGKMAGEVGRDVAMQLVLARLGVPKAAVTAAPIVAGTLQGAFEEGDSPQQRVVGGAKGLAASLAGEALGAGAGALVKAPLRAVGSAVTDFVSRRFPGAGAVPTPEVPATALETLPEAAAKRNVARAKNIEIEDIRRELVDIEKQKKLAEDLAATNDPAASAVARKVGQSMRALKEQLRQAGVTSAEIRDIMSGTIQGRSAMTAATTAAEKGLAAEEAALMQRYGQAAGEVAQPAIGRATARGVAEYAVPPGSERRQTRPGAKYGTPDWTEQLREAGVSPEMIADIEARMARLPGEPPAGERDGDGPSVSPMLRLQRPPVADDATLRSAGSAARQLASGQLQLLGQYYTRTQDPAVIPDMQRLGEWVGGIRK